MTLKCQEIPVINFCTIWKYMIEAIDTKKQLLTAKPLVKGYNFYKSGHMLSVFVCSRERKCLIKSKVLPSMKKNCVYSFYIVHLSNGHVKESYCGCPAGVDSRCNYIAATLFALEDILGNNSRNINKGLHGLQSLALGIYPGSVKVMLPLLKL